MAELLSGNGFNIAGAGAFIGQHSYSKVIPVAMGRPDEKDLEDAAEFGARSLESSGYLTSEDMPVQLDMFSKSKNYNPLKPVFYPAKCTQCSECADLCPTGIISPETGGYIHEKATDDCIGCMSCVLNCDNEARLTKPGFMMKTMIRFILRKAAVQRLDPLTIFKEQMAPAT
jgi:Pyruvate/2-oxoacid:ferredoxin oxidoreductase delta subunit